ncbi:hypothetical protein P3W45_000683 [Vairimorpha bombi]|jgi:hypothetical protein
MSEKKTKTLLITDIEDISSFGTNLKSKYEINEVYTIPTNTTLLFVIFFNIKESERCYKDLLLQNYKVHYTISKYELPKDQEKCEKGKNQSTVFITQKNRPINENEEIIKAVELCGEIRDIRDTNIYTKCFEYFDSRSADRCVKEFSTKKYKDMDVSVKYVWDMSTKTKWDIIRYTDNILSQQAVVQKRKVSSLKKNLFINILDEFISENINEISKAIMRK